MTQSDVPRIGSLVEVGDLKSLGQLTAHLHEENKVEVHLINGGATKVDPQTVKVPTDLKKPGMDGASEESFDILFGPQTQNDAMAAEMSQCIFEKGYCVIKFCVDEKTSESIVNTVREMGDEGQLARFPSEVEEGYFGAGGKGKIAWLDPTDPEKPKIPSLDFVDKMMDSIATQLQPYSMDVLGQFLEDRSASLVSLTLLDEEEDDYPVPMADDVTLGEYLTNWKLGLLRAVVYMGPGSSDVTLSNRGGQKSAGIPNLQENAKINATPNTLLVFRTEVFDYSCNPSDEVLTVTSNMLAQAPQWILDSWTGDPTALKINSEGPQEARGDRICIMHYMTRLAAEWDEPEAMAAGIQGGCDAVTEIPTSRFDIDFYFVDNPDEILIQPRPGTIQRHTSLIDGAELFDNKYFEITVNEAGGMGPMQRQVLETGGRLLAAGGITKKDTNRTSHQAGCSVGLDKDDFPELLNNGWATVPGGGGNNAMAIIANRFSFVFNLKGSNYICDTACSASLTATHLAKLMLLERKIDPLEFHLALGIHMCLSPGPWIGCSMSRMVSPEGRCFTFNATANGYLRGEGSSGMWLQYGTPDLKGVGVYRASQSGQDGRSASLTAPNGPAQEYIIRNSIKEAGIGAAESTTWDCHGTGTSLGDPIEVGAVRKVMIKTEREQPLMITTVKSYIGHMEGGAAMAAMCKTLTQIIRNEAFASQHISVMNPNLENTTFDAFFVSEHVKFPYKTGLSHCSSFGFGGTNGHVIFWGEGLGDMPTVNESILRKLQKMSWPEVRPIGDDPDDWETDGLELNAEANAKYTITFNADDPPDTAVRWEKIADTAAEEDEEDEDIFYAITGNFNAWESDRMSPGDLPGQHIANVVVPDSGSLEFRFLQEDDEAKVICPKTSKCTRKTEEIVGPTDSGTNTWVVEEEPDTELQVELFVMKGRRGVVWFKI